MRILLLGKGIDDRRARNIVDVDGAVHTLPATDPDHAVIRANRHTRLNRIDRRNLPRAAAVEVASVVAALQPHIRGIADECIRKPQPTGGHRLFRRQAGDARFGAVARLAQIDRPATTDRHADVARRCRVQVLAACKCRDWNHGIGADVRPNGQVPAQARGVPGARCQVVIAVNRQRIRAGSRCGPREAVILFAVARPLLPVGWQERIFRNLKRLSDKSRRCFPRFERL